MSSDSKTHDEAAKLLQTASMADVDRRVTSLEGSQKDLSNHLLTRHTQFITWMFTVVGLILVVASISVTVMGVLSKNESQAASQRMEKQVDDAISKMNTRFDRLSGEYFKQPDVEILMSGGVPLNGRKLAVRQGGQQSLGPLFIRNKGQKRTEPLSVRLFCSPGITMSIGEWFPFSAMDTNYAASYVYYNSFMSTVAAGDTLTLENAMVPNTVITNGTCKLQIYYGGDGPAEATFYLYRK